MQILKTAGNKKKSLAGHTLPIVHSALFFSCSNDIPFPLEKVVHKLKRTGVILYEVAWAEKSFVWNIFLL